MFIPNGGLPPAPMYSAWTTGRQQLASVPASAVWPTANKAYFAPITLNVIVVVQKLWWVNGTVASNNIDIGIFTADGTKLVSSGSIARSGVNSQQSFTLTTPLTLTAGAYYIGMASDGTTGTNFRAGVVAPALIITGMLTQTTAFPLPANATFATGGADSFLPFCGFSTVLTI